MTDITAVASEGRDSSQADRSNNAAVFNQNTSVVTMVDVIAAGSGNGIGAVECWGVYNVNSSVTMTGGAAEATTCANTWAVHNVDSMVSLDNVTVVSDRLGVRGSGSIVIRDSFITGGTVSVFREGGVWRMSDTMLAGNTENMAGRCFDVYDTGLVTYTCI